MTTERITLLAAAVLAGVAAVASLESWLGHKQQTGAFTPFGTYDATTHIDSPITASGGSMTFRSQSMWSCSSPIGQPPISTICTSATNITAFSAIRLYRQDPNNNTNFFSAPSYSSSNALADTVTFYIRNSSGDPGPAPTPHTSPSTPFITLTSGGGQVKIQVNNVNNSQAGLVNSDAGEPSGSTNVPATTYAVQYFDPTCLVHGTSNIPPSPVPACEHPGWVNWVDSQNYLCVDGVCWVALDD
jgi:hypothetical protein